jgi:hypothetical protein
MPGHMNVWLAEADVSYEQLVEMHAIQRVLPGVDVGGLKRGLSRVGVGETDDGWASR